MKVRSPAPLTLAHSLMSYPNTNGLVYISQIAKERVENVSDYLTEGQTVKVLVQDVDNRGRIKLTMKEVEQDAGAE